MFAPGAASALGVRGGEFRIRIHNTMSDDQFSKEGLVFSEIVSGLMVSSMAINLIHESRFKALLDVLGNPPSTFGIAPPSSAELLEMLALQAKPYLDRRLAELSDDHPTLVSVVHQMLPSFLPDPE